MLELDRAKIYLPSCLHYTLMILKKIFQEKGIDGLQSVTESIEVELMMYLKLLILLYGDDTVLMVESADDLQCALNEFSIYCTKWKLNVNVEKKKF